MSETGKISIDVDNMLPIIKKWLYSEREIFVRELVSNGFDAIKKLKKIVQRESLDLDVSDPSIVVTVDEEAKTITFSDTGLGLDADEVKKYINQVAFSGAHEFMESYKDKDDTQQIIGHFGLGFYSSFMISDLVEIKSLSYKAGAKPVLWSCDGSPEYKLQEGDRQSVGTDIVLHVSDDQKEFLAKERLTTLVKKYANFLPVTIKVNDEEVNHKEPLWLKSPSEVTDEEYKAFYQTLFPFSQEPLFWIHLNVDYPFNLQGILYFPKLMHELDSQKGRIQLFCQQVFVSDDAKEVVPEFLTLLQGAIDCPDIPLNVSRSYLQNDPYVLKISKHIVKKVGDKLLELYKNDLENFQTYWADIHPFIKYGMMQNNEFYEKVKDIVIFESSDGGFTTIPDYLERNQEKLDKKVLYCANKESQATYVAMCKEQGLEVIMLSTLIDTHFIQFLESKDTDTKYVAVDTEVSESLVDESPEVGDGEDKSDSDNLIELFKSKLGDDALKVEVKALKSEDVSGVILESEMSKRLKAMSHMMQGAMPGGMEDFTFVVNRNHKLVKHIAALDSDGKSPDVVKELCEHVYDLAQMSHKQLSGDKMQAFIARSNRLLGLLG